MMIRLIVAHRTLDRKHVNLLSTTYNTQPVLTGKLHWQTKEPMECPKIIHMYGKYLGGVDCNDQQMKYSAFSHRTLQKVEESSFQASKGTRRGRNDWGEWRD